MIPITYYFYTFVSFDKSPTTRTFLYYQDRGIFINTQIKSAFVYCVLFNDVGFPIFLSVLITIGTTIGGSLVLASLFSFV